MVPVSEVLMDLFAQLETRHEEGAEFSGVPTDFYDLDAMTQGFQPSDLIIVAARPAMGKTSFCLSIGYNVASLCNLPVVCFSLEMSKEQIMYRLLSMETNINQMKLRSGKIYQNDWLKINKIIKILSKLPFFIDDTPDLSIQDIRSKIKTLVFEQSQIGLIIIDYLQLMQSSKLKTENRVQELSLITRSLKNIAREFNIPIIALSQLSRNVENRIDKKPILSDLRESGSIEQDADLVLMLYRSKYYNSNQINEKTSYLTEVIIAKHRNGPIGSIKLKFDEKRTKFLNFD